MTEYFHVVICTLLDVKFTPKEINRTAPVCCYLRAHSLSTPITIFIPSILLAYSNPRNDAI